MKKAGKILLELWKDGFRAGEDDVQCNRESDILDALKELAGWVRSRKQEIDPSKIDSKNKTHIIMNNMIINNALEDLSKELEGK